MQMAMNTGYAARPLHGEMLCGDVGAWWQWPQRRILALADGLGHGPAAHHAAQEAMHCIARHGQSNCFDLFAACNDSLIDTRGAVLAIALIDQASNLLTLGSIGNIRAILLKPDSHLRLGSGRGIVGAGFTWMVPDQVLLAPGDMLLMLSDGIDEIDDIAALRSSLGSLQETPQMLADKVLATLGRVTDDAAVLVYRHGSAS
jgi:negative regulator of sigma-B (phosphoserine phosphatase)